MWITCRVWVCRSVGRSAGCRVGCLGTPASDFACERGGCAVGGKGGSDRCVDPNRTGVPRARSGPMDRARRPVRARDGETGFKSGLGFQSDDMLRGRQDTGRPMRRLRSVWAGAAGGLRARSIPMYPATLWVTTKSLRACDDRRKRMSVRGTPSAGRAKGGEPRPKKASGRRRGNLNRDSKFHRPAHHACAWSAAGKQERKKHTQRFRVGKTLSLSSSSLPFALLDRQVA